MTRDSLARHFAQFFLLPLGYQRVNKSSIRAKKRVISLIKTLMVPTMEFLFILWYTKGRKKNWPKCHWPKFYWPKCLISISKLSLAKRSLWPNCSLAKVSQSKNLWPKCHSCQTVIQPPYCGKGNFFFFIFFGELKILKEHFEIN